MAAAKSKPYELCDLLLIFLSFFSFFFRKMIFVVLEEIEKNDLLLIWFATRGAQIQPIIQDLSAFGFLVSPAQRGLLSTGRSDGILRLMAEFFFPRLQIPADARPPACVQIFLSALADKIFCTGAAFTSYRNPKYFLFHPSHQIFKRMHETLTVGKKKLIA
jgi:hypothetical protein